MRVLPGEKLAAFAAFLLLVAGFAAVNGSATTGLGGADILTVLAPLWIALAVCGTYAVVPAAFRLTHPRRL